MPDRILTTRELNRALLARQLLLERSALPIPRAVERIGGVQTQYAPSAYVGLWSRLSGLERSSLTAALERRSVVQATLMRATIHIVSRADYWPLAAAIRAPLRQWWLRAAQRTGDEDVLAAIADEVRRLLADGPMRRGDIVGRLGIDSMTWNGIGAWLDLVRVPPSGTWDRRRADLYALADEWVGPPTSDPATGLDLLVRRYLTGFGPASRKDVQSFTGLPMSLLTTALDTMSLRRFRNENGGELIDLPRAPLPDGDTPVPVRFIPTWDAILLVHARRTQVLPERFRSLVFSTRTPHSFPTFLVDGQVAGTWRYDKGRITLEPFDPLPRTTRRQLEEEAARLEAFHA